jgi:hypothetical protein
MSPEEATKFPQVNACLKVRSLGTVESILSQTDGDIFAKHPTPSGFEKIFEAIETTLQIQENHIAGQDSETAGLHAKITELNEDIVTISMESSGHHGNKTKKSVIANPDIFKANKLDNKKNQELFQTFSAQVELKMMGDSKCFETDQERILYVASRVSAPAYKNIQPCVIEGREGGFANWRELPEVLRRVYDVADKRAAAEREMATLQQKHLPFVQFLAQFNMLLADLSWDNSAKVSALKARINDGLSQALIPVIQTPELNDFDGWVNLLVRLADNAEAHAHRKRPNISHTLIPSQPQHNTDAAQMGPPSMPYVQSRLATSRRRALSPRE